MSLPDVATLLPLEAAIVRALRADRYRLRRQLESLKRLAANHPEWTARRDRLRAAVERSIDARVRRQENLPKIEYDDQLPVSARRGEIADAIRENQVVIVCGETGSGKSTQLPKICLELGRGIEATIGHTQPRRIAARSIAARVAEELKRPLGDAVGFKVRFAEAISPASYIKLMTDGVLLAELQSDPHLDQYDTIIVDEAHERSLNIDFLLGYLKRLLPRRRDLKLIITSATIDAARFAEHFGTKKSPAPIIEVTGRTYPVEIRWRPIEPDPSSDQPDWLQGVLAAVDELSAIDEGDMLVFMPTERDIHETAKALRGRKLPGDGPGRTTDILPLYARLSVAEQQKVFQPHNHRRIVIATNVAESSLTVPRIRYVIDPGTARISRYSARTKTQRLPIEPIAQASADQRMGRCGRVGPGIGIRLYDEDDYAHRERYTPPEIQRTNLAAVILECMAFRLGDIEGFPFLDPPRPDVIRDGYKTLFELGAIDDRRRLTEIGRRLSRLPVDPRIGRMILAAEDESCLHEVLVIAAALEAQDPRERPLEKQQAADQAHLQFAAEDSDFLEFLKIWEFFHGLKRKLSRNQLQRACRQNFLSFNRLREWADLHRELLEVCQRAGLKASRPCSDFAAIHRAILTGLLSGVALRGDTYDYQAAGGGKFNLWPGSAVFGKKPRWIVAAEAVETNKKYLRCCAKIDPAWIEPLAEHLVHRSYFDAYWEEENGSALAFEKVTLFGLPVVARRRVALGPLDPEAARQLLIQHGLVEGHLRRKPAFLRQNEALLAELEQMQAKLRRSDVLLGPWARYDFYDHRLPANVYDATRLKQWLGGLPPGQRNVLVMGEKDLLRDDPPTIEPEAFPAKLSTSAAELPIHYKFEPGAADDGLTITVPVEVLAQINPQRLGWLVPGLVEQKVLAMIRSLPKDLRRHFVPAADTAKRVMGELRFGEGDFAASVADSLSQIAGARLSPELFEEDKLPADLRINLRVLDAAGKEVAAGRDLAELQRRMGAEPPPPPPVKIDPRFQREGLSGFELDELPVETEIRRGDLAIKAFPGLLDQGESLSVRLFDTLARAERETRIALRRLFLQATRRTLQTQVNWLPGLNTMQVHAASLNGFDLKQALAELIVERAFLVDQPLVRTREAFDRRKQEGEDRLGLAVQDVVERVTPIWPAYHQAKLALEQAASAHYRHATDDVKQQLGLLFGPDFLAVTPWDWLAHYPRFLKAIAVRLERMSAGNLARDRQYTAELAEWWKRYRERADEHAARGVFDPELELLRWMMEEYRVSLFAQKLGTSLPVSAARLEKQWNKSTRWGPTA